MVWCIRIERDPWNIEMDKKIAALRKDLDKLNLVMDERNKRLSPLKEGEQE